MSGIATGWVGRHGPRPDDVNRLGDPYAGRARGLRMTLLAVADSANSDGKHAHPGVENVAAFTLYSVGQARRLLMELVDEGWLIVTEEGGGRGRATVYDLAYENRHRNPRTMRRFDDDKRAHGEDKRAHGGSETRASGDLNARMTAQTRASGCAPNGLTTTTNGTTNGLTNARSAISEAVEVIDLTTVGLNAMSPVGDVTRVFDAWLLATQRTGRTVLTEKRKRVILTALKSYSVDDVVDAVRGWRNSPYHCGDNRQRTVYNGLELLLRDAEHIEKFRDLERGQDAPPQLLNQNMRQLQQLARGELG